MMEVTPAPAPAGGPGLAETARESGAALEGLMLADGTLILKVERAGRARQLRFADGGGFDPHRGSFDYTLRYGPDWPRRVQLRAGRGGREGSPRRVPGEVALLGDTLGLNGAPAGRVCSSAWSPFQQCGVAIVRLHDPDLGPGTMLEVQCTDGETRRAIVCDTPMYDENREIPRGQCVDIPEILGAEEA